MELILNRTPIDDKHSIGVLTVVEGSKELFKCKTVERGWLNNKPNVSCVPPGVYRLEYEMSSAFGMFLWELKDVDGRSECKIHTANYWHQLRGCIAVGDLHSHLDSDGRLDVKNSRTTLMKLHEVLKGQKILTLTITH